MLLNQEELLWLGTIVWNSDLCFACSRPKLGHYLLRCEKSVIQFYRNMITVFRYPLRLNSTIHCQFTNFKEDLFPRYKAERFKESYPTPFLSSVIKSVINKSPSELHQELSSFLVLLFSFLLAISSSQTCDGHSVMNLQLKGFPACSKRRAYDVYLYIMADTIASCIVSMYHYSLNRQVSQFRCYQYLWLQKRPHLYKHQWIATRPELHYYCQSKNAKSDSLVSPL